jgi:sugar lactone lactonase YvrE
VKVAELVDGEPVPYPDADTQAQFQSVLSLRIDRQNRLWTLDNANHGIGDPRLLAFNLRTSKEVSRHDFAREIAGRGSHLNDFQIAPDGKRIYIADASILAKKPAIIVFDVERGTSRRLLEGHPSVVPERYVPVVQGRKMAIAGLFAIRPGVDSIALDRPGRWLYFAPVTNNHLYRARRRDLDDESLSAQELALRVEQFATKTMSDGITTDLAGNIYLSDLEHSAIVRLGADGRLQTLLKDPLIRWPDGLGFGPGGWLYVTCSALHQVIGRSGASIRSDGPYQIFRFQPGAEGIPGH